MSAQGETTSSRTGLFAIAALAYTTLTRIRRDHREWYVLYQNQTENQQRRWSRFAGDPVSALRAGEIAFAIRSTGIPGDLKAS